MSPLNCVKEGPHSSDGWSGGFLKSPASSLPVGPTLYLGPESRFSGGLAQFGRICAMEREIKAGLRRRSSRRVNMMARRNPARAPRNPSVIERLLKVRRPWPVRRNPVYARTTVQTIARTFTGPHTPAGFSKVISTVPPPEHLHWLWTQEVTSSAPFGPQNGAVRGVVGEIGPSDHAGVAAHVIVEPD